MSRFLFLLAALLATPAHAQLLPPATTAPLTPEMTPEQLLTQYRHDEINLLALRADPHSLLAAALMARADAHDKTRPVALQPPALLKRAQDAGPNDVLVWWVTAGVECRNTNKACPEPETLQKLESADAENAGVWALALWRAQQAKDNVTARAALTSAAQAKRYNDRFGGILAAIYDAESILPMNTELLNATGQSVSVDGYRLITAAGIAASLVQPAGAAIIATCRKAPADAAENADCVAVAKKMEAAGSLGAQRLGVNLLQSLLPPGPEQDAVLAHARSLAWQTQQIESLADRLANDTRVTRAYMQALTDSGDETAAVYAVLRSQGVALEPTADWQAPPDAASQP